MDDLCPTAKGRAKNGQQNNPSLHRNLRKGWIVLLATNAIGRIFAEVFRWTFQAEVIGEERQSGRNETNLSRRINVAAAKHQRCSCGFAHTAGNRNSGPAQRW